MTNCSKCPLYPKPHKGATIKTNYTSIVNSVVRTETTFAQIAQATLNSDTSQQMTPHSGPVPATIQPTTQAKITPFPTQQKGRYLTTTVKNKTNKKKELPYSTSRILTR
ncbi:hypothetical protein TNCV_4278221 [Trichonephila clavipes]|nr:hypothetical protein TNCV_4278221 [Trichonephila clavipes]